jgi:hypothetical protein
MDCFCLIDTETLSGQGNHRYLAFDRVPRDAMGGLFTPTFEIRCPATVRLESIGITSRTHPEPTRPDILDFQEACVEKFFPELGPVDGFEKKHPRSQVTGLFELFRCSK